MKIFVDTSAFLAVLNTDDRHHPQARDFWFKIVQEEAMLVVTNYILLETYALLQRRLGMEAVRVFSSDVVPALRVMWVDERLHQLGLSAMLAADRRGLSLVDCISFEAARSFGIRHVFTFDKHFTEQGFICHPTG